MFARIENNSIVEFPVNIRLLYPTVSWPQDLETLSDAELPKNIVRIYDTTPDLSSTEHKFSIALPNSFMNSGGKWIRTYSIIKTPLPKIKAEIKQKVTAKREEIEFSGITVNGLQIDTTLKSQTRINNLIANSTRLNRTLIHFKANTWTDLTFLELTDISNKIGTFVEQCFNVERDHHLSIDQIQNIADGATAIQQLLNYDINANWPSNIFTS